MYKKIFSVLILSAISSVCFAHGAEEHNLAEIPEYITREKSDAIVGGEWSDVYDWPVLAVHATVLPTGNVFVWDATPDDFDTEFDGSPTNFHDSQRNQTRVTVWNPKTNQHMQTYNPEGTGDLFCAGSVHLTDGRIIFVGGDSGVSGKNGPTSNSNIYDPYTNQWSTTDNLNAARWYASSVSLPNGEILTLGGTYTPTPYGEILEHNKQYREFNGELDSPLVLSGDYAWLSVVSDGSVAYVGPHNRVDSLYTDDTFEKDKWINGPRRDINELEGELASYRGYGSYATYDTDKVLISGGGSSIKSSVIVDTKNRSVTETSPMNFGRRQHNLTILADGSVLATGGNWSGEDLYDPNAGVVTPEIWNPNTGDWTIMNDMKVDRQYHSVALLLPDARVLLAGSGYCVPCFTFDHEEQNAEIFSPPYLFKGERPVISGAPEKANFNTYFNMNVSTDITEVNFIKLSSVTHSQSQDQRLVKGEIISQANGVATIAAPKSRFLAPPGHYMVFAVKNGVPSEAAIVNFGGPLVETGDVMINNARPNHWEYYEIKGNDEHTLTVNFNTNLNAASIHVKNGSWPTDPNNSGFNSCASITDDQHQCVISAQNDTSWFIGVNGKANTEFSISFDVTTGTNAQVVNFIAKPENLTLAKLGDGRFEVVWNSVDGAKEYEIFRDGRLVNKSDDTYYVADNLQAMRTYSFQVLAIATDGSRSTLTDAQQIRTSDQPYIIDPTSVFNPVIPSTPVDLRMYKTSPSEGTLTWGRSYDDKGVSGYIIYRNGVEIGRRNDAGIGFNQFELEAGQTYEYAVAAFDFDGNTSPKSVVFRTTGSTFVTDSNMAPARKNPDFNPVVDNTPVVEVHIEVPVVETPVVEEPNIEENTATKSGNGALFRGSINMFILISLLGSLLIRLGQLAKLRQ